MTVSNIETAFPLSPLQQGMLFHSLEAPGSAMYVLQVCGEFRGDLNVAAFARAWQHVVARHQALRAAFVWDDVDEPLQVIGRRVRVPFHYQDWSAMSGGEQRATLKTSAMRDRMAGFTLSRAPLMRILVARLAERRHAVMWTSHHLVADGWSRAILLDEV